MSSASAGKTTTATPTTATSKPAVAIGKRHSEGIKEGIKETIDKIIGVVIPIIVEFLRLLPDGLVFGVALMSLLSFCTSYGVLLFSMVELMVIQRLLSGFIGSIAPTGAGQNAGAAICQNGFAFPNMLRISMIDSVGKPSTFPSSSMFFLVAVVTYIISSIQQFKKEISTLGGDVNLRTTIATSLSILFMIFMFMYRLNYGCDTFGNILLTMILGLAAGIAIVYQNLALFGRSGVNILNLPLIVSTTESGKPMYVCGPTQD
jgi:hypothetical protein